MDKNILNIKPKLFEISEDKIFYKIIQKNTWHPRMNNSVY